MAQNFFDVFVCFFRIYYTYSKTGLTENVFPLIPALTLTLTLTLFLNHNNVFELTSFFEKVYIYRFFIALLAT